jgi:3-hydroxyacyl-[acyl-carrier-protein] dehydratase
MGELAHALRGSGMTTSYPTSDNGDRLSHEEILARIPQAEPFRFIDSIVAVDDDTIVSRVRFRPDADFYRGHFPGLPITPGVILLEAMAQGGLVAHAIYIMGRRSLGSSMPLFANATVEFRSKVAPGEEVLIHGRKVYFRRSTLRSEVKMVRANGELVAAGTLTGVMVTQ